MKLGTILGAGIATALLLSLVGGKSKARAFVPANPDVIELEEITVTGDPRRPVVTYKLGDKVRVLTLGRIGVITSFPRAIDPRYPPVEVVIPGFPPQVFAAQDIQHA